MELLEKWLNEDLPLSRSVSSVEDAFTNGYLLGEILHIFNQQNDFSAFEDKDSAKARLRNFCLLEPTIRGLGVRFDSKDALAIMARERGVAARLLYQIKMAIDNLSKRAPISTRAVKAGGVVPLCNMPMRPAKPTFDSVGHNFFEKSLRMMMENENDTLAARALERFEVEKQRQGDDAARSQYLEETLLTQRKQEMRAHRMHQTKREHEFLADWQAKGAQEWAINQRIATERRAVKARCVAKAQSEMLLSRTAARDRDATGMRDDIDDFEQRLPALTVAMTAREGAMHEETAAEADGEVDTGAEATAVAPETADELYSRLESTQPDERARHAAARQYMDDVRRDRDSSALERDAKRRRRKMFVAERQQRRVDEEQGLLMDVLKDSLTRAPQVELQIEEELKQTRQLVPIFVENRNFREAQHASRRQIDDEEAIARDRAAYEAEKLWHGTAADSQRSRYVELNEARRCAAHERVVVVCAEVTQSIVDLALWRAHHRELTSSASDTAAEQGVPPFAWEEQKRLFIAGVQVDPRSCCSAHTSGAIAPADGADELLDEAEFNDVLLCTGLHAAEREVERSQAAAARHAAELQSATALMAAENVSTAGDDNSDSKGKGDEGDSVEGADVKRSFTDAEAAAAAEPNYAMGDTIQDLRLSANPLPAPPVAPAVVKHKLCVCITGRRFTGKSALAQRVAKRCHLERLEVADLLQRALKAAEEGPLDVTQVKSDMASAKRMARIRRKFDALDEDDSGYLEGGEVRELAKWVLSSFAAARDGTMPDEAEQDRLVKKLMTRVDEDGDGRMSFEEFAAYYERTVTQIAKYRRGQAEKKKRAEALEAQRLALAQQEEAARAAGGEEAAADVRAQDEAAQRLQAIQRGRAQRREAAEQKEQDEAAQRLQAISRGRRDRANARMKKSGNDTAVERRVRCHNRFVALGEAARSALRSGGAVADETLADLVVAAANGLDTNTCNGWILSDFPDTVAQARLLEKAMSGYDETVHLPAPLDRASRLVPPTPVPPPDPEAKLPSGLHLVLHIDCDRDTLYDRALGRRVDPLRGVHYHLLDAPPAEPAEGATGDAIVDGRASTENPGVRQRLEQVVVSEAAPTDAAKALADLSSCVAVYDEGSAELRTWFDRFGTGRTLDEAALGGRDAVEAEAEQHCQAILQADSDRRRAAAEKARAERDAAKAKAEAEAAAEAERVEREQALRAALEEAEAAAAAAATAEAEADKKEKKAAKAARQAADAAVTSAREELEAEHAATAAAAAAAAAEAEADSEGQEPPPTLAAGLAQPAAELWDASERQFCEASEDAMRQMRTLRASCTAHLHATTDHFARFVRRPADFQARIDEFHAAFNSVDHDMRFDERTKDELHLRTDKLGDELWARIEQREEEALAELEAIRGEKWREAVASRIVDLAAHQMQLEVDLCHAQAHAALESAQGKLGSGFEGLQEPPELEEGESWHPAAPPIAVAELYMTAEQREDEGKAAAKKKSPKKAKGKAAAEEDEALDERARLAAICASVLEMLSGDGGEDGGSGAAAAAASAKGKRKASAAPIEDDMPKPTIGEEAIAALTEARARARSIARGRVARLRLGAQTSLDALDAEAQATYRRMHTALSLRAEAEGTAVGALLAIVRDAIESESDLPFDLRVDAPDQYRFPFLAALAADTDVTLDQGVRWLPEPVPPPPPIVDNVDPDGVAFSGAQLAAFDAMLQAAMRAGGRGSGAQGAITCRRLAACMARAATHDTALPLRWQQLDMDAFDSFARYFEQDGSGEADIADVCTKLSTADGAAEVLAVSCGIDAADPEQQAAAGKLQGQWRMKESRKVVQAKRDELAGEKADGETQDGE